MKIQNNRKNQGFTLVEMIGVLAVIAILAAMLIPKIMQAINNSRINSSIESLNTAKTAAADYYGKFGRWGIAGGDALTTTVPDYGAVLLAEKFLEKPFQCPIGSRTSGDAGTRIEILPGDVIGAWVVGTTDADDAAFDLDNDTTAANDASGQWVVRAVIKAVTPEDQKELNDRIDGVNTWAAATLHAKNNTGRVKYDATVGGASGDVYVYLAHR